jgi:hypothetical protein
VTPLPVLHIQKKLDKPKIDMPALKIAIGIILGIVNLTPMGKLLSTGVMGIADAASHGKASNFVNNGNNVNGTLAMLPGGMLAQQVANDSTHGKSGNVLGKFVPDPKKMIMNSVIKLTETIVTNPKSTLDVAHELDKENKDSMTQIGKNHIKVVHTTASSIDAHKSTIPHTITHIPKHSAPVKPTLFTAISPPPIQQSVSTLPSIAQSTLPSIAQSVLPSIAQSTIPTIAQSTLPGTVQSILPVYSPITVAESQPQTSTLGIISTGTESDNAANSNPLIAAFITIGLACFMLL